MMQQLATQRSQIAAFPESLPESAAKGDSTQATESVLPIDSKQSADIHQDNAASQTSAFAEELKRQQGKEETAKRAQSSKDEAESARALEPQQADTQQVKRSESSTDERETGAEPNAMPDKMATGVADDEADDKLAQHSEGITVQSSRERIKNAALDDGNLIDTAMLAGTNETLQSEGEYDYLALVDAVRALQDKLSTSDNSPQSNDNSPQSTDDQLDTNEPLSAEDVIGMLPTEIGNPVEGDVKGELLNTLQDWLSTLIPGDLPNDTQASPLQQMRGAEQVLSDLLALVKQIKAVTDTDTDTVSATDTAGQTEAELMAILAANNSETSSADNTDVENMAAQHSDDETQRTEENVLALAMALLHGLPNERHNAESAATDTANEGDNAVLVDLTSNTVALADEPIDIADVTDDSLLNQAKLLVSLMRQSQTPTEAPQADTKVSNDSVGVKRIDLNNLDAMVTNGTDKTLQALAQVMTDSASKANPALTDTQLSQMRSQLTTGLEEMRAQLKQGHQPGIDLAALVNLTAQNIAPESNQNIVLPVLQDVQQLTQLAAMAGMSQGQEQQLTELVNVARDVLVNETRQQHGDNQKSIQQQAVFDKPVNVQQAQGQQQIAEKIRWMVNGRQSMAEIRLDPPEMGSMQIRLNVSGDSASVSFVVQSQQAKDALNEAMPRLREMFSEQGMDLGESFVNQQNSGDTGEGNFADQQGGGFAEQGEEEVKNHETHVIRPANGLIDDYV